MSPSLFCASADLIPCCQNRALKSNFKRKLLAEPPKLWNKFLSHSLAKNSGAQYVDQGRPVDHKGSAGR